MSKIYIVEDDRNIREIERYALQNGGFVIQEFETGAELFAAIKEEVPALVLLDVMLPNEDGLDILRQLRLRNETRSLPVIMVTAKTTELDKVKGLDMGADDYITKPFGVMELISRVKAVLRRTVKSEDQEVLSCQNILLNTKKHSVKADGTACELTFKEFELLHYLMTNEGIVLTRDKIMDQVWGFEYEGESRTVDMHIKTLRQKLGESGKAIKTIRNVGYMIE